MNLHWRLELQRKQGIKQITYISPVSYTHLDVYKRQVILQRDEPNAGLKNLNITK